MKIPLRANWILAACACLGGADAAPLAYEPFSAYNLDQNLGAATQPPPPVSTGVLDYTTPNTILIHHARAESLSYGMLLRSGGKLELATGGVALQGTLNLAADGPFQNHLQSGMVGKDGTTLYLSLLLKMEGTGTSSSQAYFSLGQGTSPTFLIGQSWQQSQFSVGSSLPIPLDTAIHLVVIRISYQAGNDTVTVWWDPVLASGEIQTPTSTQSRNAGFNSFQFQGMGNRLFVDEIRFGASWGDVVPEEVLNYTLTATAGANGLIHQDPVRSVYLPNDEVYIEAIPDSGYRFSHWTGDVPVGQTNTNPLRLSMNANHSLQAHFVTGIADFFSVKETSDAYGTEALLDLRSLNENTAGQTGFVKALGDRLALGDNTPVRFWGVNVSMPQNRDADGMMAFLSKRGVNLIRLHANLYSNSAPSLATASTTVIDDMQQLASAAKAEGIYTKLSPFFILGLRIQAGWGVEGYTSQWIDANNGGTGETNYANEAPFGLQFFDASFKTAYKNWIRELLTRPNPHVAGQTPLGQEPAVAILELMNEDNLFFWTFKPTRYPLVQQQNLFKLFHDHLVATYGSFALAKTAWGWTAQDAASSLYAADDSVNGRAAVLEAWFMTRSYSGTTGERARIADQIRFLAELQKDWYEEMHAYVRDSLGSPVLTVASNWTTADNPVLMDAETYSYTAADVLDKHNYLTPLILNMAETVNVSGGDTFYAAPCLNNPRTLPAVYKHVAGKPSIISESTWVNPHDFKAEGPLLIASYGALNGLDGFIWFATHDVHWQNGTNRWEIASPALAGTFPAAALIFRRGDVASPPAVVNEGRTLEGVAAKVPSLFFETPGWDPTRDPTGSLTAASSVGAGQSIDPLAALVGPVEIHFDSETDFVSPSLAAHIDNTARVVTSLTGELALHWGHPPGVSPPNNLPPTGLFQIDTPRAQGAVGFLGTAGKLSLGQIDLEMTNPFGTVVAISLDGQPLVSSTRVLIQSATRENLRRSLYEDVVLTLNGTNYLGHRILEIGGLPWQMQGITASVTLKGMGLIRSFQVLDSNGYLATTKVNPTPQGEHQVVSLPGDALYCILTLDPLASIYDSWTGFTPEQHSDTALSAPGADPNGDGVSNLLAYALDLDPLSAATAINLPHAETSTAGADTFLSLAYRKNAKAIDIAYTVQTSTDLSVWTDAVPDGLNVIEETTDPDPDADGSAKRIRVRIKVPANEPRHFLRLKVTR